jgi:hypothetical protein
MGRNKGAEVIESKGDELHGFIVPQLPVKT